MSEESEREHVASDATGNSVIIARRKARFFNGFSLLVANSYRRNVSQSDGIFSRFFVSTDFVFSREKLPQMSTDQSMHGASE